MSDVDTLRRAAALMRERAKKARAGEWFASGVEVAAEWSAAPRNVALTYGSVVPEGNIANAEHIASWHPAVALAVADWLDQMARVLDRTCDCNWPAEPFALARAYLGGE